LNAQLSTKLPSAGTLVLLGGICLAAAIALAYAFRRRRELFPLLAVATLPLRLPITTGGRTVNLLIPLYIVILAGIIAGMLPWPRAVFGGRGSWWRPPRARTVAILLAATIVLYALQATYSTEPKKAVENLVFFYIPFGLMFAMLLQLRWDRRLLLRCLYVSVGLAAIFVAIGLVEEATSSLLLNAKLVASNEYQGYFRVNSVFYDPNIYGRFLALVMIGVMAGVLWTNSPRVVRAGAAALAWLLVGLVTSFSQSSMAALLLGLAVLAAWRWSLRRTVTVAAAAAVAVLALIVLAPASFHFGLKGTGGSVSTTTNGRSKLASGGLRIFRERPLFGYGSGSFERQYRAGESAAELSTSVSASHTTPVTVAAEQGLIGLAVYVVTLVAALLVLFRGARGSPERMAIAAAFAALVLHTWTYADYLEDPFTWALLAVGCALSRGAADSV